MPDNRLRTYEIRDVIDGLADTGSVLELRRDFGLGMVTALCRIEGRPVGILANDPNHLAGAIDSDGSDKAARFMQLCDAFDIPLLVLCDTPGIMVGPEIEKTGLVRHCNRLFVTGANLSIPMFMVVMRKAYGLGALAMAGGSVMEPFFCVAWPTGDEWPPLRSSPRPLPHAHRRSPLPVASGFVSLHSKYYGRGPTKSKVYAERDLVVVVLEETFTPAERTLIAHGQAEDIQHIRRNFQLIMADQFKSLVEQATGRKVRSFTSETDLENDISVEVFLLADDMTDMTAFEEEG